MLVPTHRDSPARCSVCSSSHMENRIRIGNSPILGSVLAVIDAFGNLLLKPAYDAGVTNPRLNDGRNDARWRKTKPALVVLSTALLYSLTLLIYTALLVDLGAIHTPASCHEAARAALGGGGAHSHTSEELLLNSKHEIMPSTCTSGGYARFTDGQETAARVGRACRPVTAAELDAGILLLDIYQAHPTGNGQLHQHAYVTLDEAVSANEELLRASPGIDFIAPKYWKSADSTSRRGAAACPLDAYQDHFNPCLLTVRVGSGEGHLLTLINPVVVDVLREPPHSHAAHASEGLVQDLSIESSTRALDARRRLRPGAAEILVAEFADADDIFYPLRISEPIYDRPTISAIDAHVCISGEAGSSSPTAHRISAWKTSAVLQLAIAALEDPQFLHRGEMVDRVEEKAQSAMIDWDKEMMSAGEEAASA